MWTYVLKHRARLAAIYGYVPSTIGSQTLQTVDGQAGPQSRVHEGIGEVRPMQPVGLKPSETTRP